MKQGDRWLIFYTNGSIFSSAEGEPWDAPRQGVLAVASCKDKAECDWYLLQQVERYYFEADKGGWNDCPDDSTFWLHFFRARCPCVVFGEMMSDANWKTGIRRVTRYCEKYREWLVGQSDDRPPKTLA